MTDLIKIAVDAMGGDGSPKKIIDGIIHNHILNKNNFFKIFGNKIQIETLIKNKLDRNEKSKKLSSFLEDFKDIDTLVDYFDDFYINLKKKTLNFFLKSVISP